MWSIYQCRALVVPIRQAPVIRVDDWLQLARLLRINHTEVEPRVRAHGQTGSSRRVTQYHALQIN